MSDRDRTKIGGDGERVREHVRKVLSKLAAYVKENAFRSERTLRRDGTEIDREENGS
jgi:hypothetical protein